MTISQDIMHSTEQDPMPLFDDWEGGFPYKEQK